MHVHVFRKVGTFLPATTNLVGEDTYYIVDNTVWQYAGDQIVEDSDPEGDFLSTLDPYQMPREEEFMLIPAVEDNIPPLFARFRRDQTEVGR